VGALAGIRVLDLTRLLPGAAATAYLVQHGAEVIKIEQPGVGDYGRTLNPRVFAKTNAGKKSVVLDLKDERGRETLRALARTADVLIEGFRPGVMARLSLHYDTLRAVNERLIYCSLSGFGQTGEYADVAGHDINYMGVGGALSLMLPVVPGVQIADLAGGSMQAVTGILLALEERHATGRGGYVDVSMLAGVQSLLTIPLAAYEETGREPQSGAGVLGGGYACYNVYQAGDGRSLAVGALESKFWSELCRRLGCEDLIALHFCEERQTTMKARLAGIFATRSAKEWFELLRDGDCCVTPVLSVSEVHASLPHVEEAPAPELGRHNDEVLKNVLPSI
jgi:crotonobetainyl-CoA:carnitine CoA-transferase CaiB-like acyl-CoA transferase